MLSDANHLLTHQTNETTRFTPRELIRYHIEHPEVPITDKDIENLVLNDEWREEYPVFKKGSNTNFLNNNSNFTKSMLF